MNAEEVRTLLIRKIAEAGSQKAFCCRNNVSHSVVSLTLSVRKPAPSILAALGLRRIVTYEPIK